MIYEHNDVRSYLQARLAADLAKNPRFSLRAFSKKAGVAPSMLSEVLNGKKKISHEMALRISGFLKMAESETEYFRLLASLELAKTSEEKQKISERMKKLAPRKVIVNLDIEAFRAISEWHHFAILEMTGLPGFKFETRKVASRLGLTQLDVKEAVWRLEKLGMLTKKPGGGYKKARPENRVASSTPNEALRKFHREMLGKAADSLATQEPKTRFIGSETFVFDSKDLAAASEIFEDCFQKALVLGSKARKPEHVYHLGIQFFSLTKGDPS